MTVEVVQLAHGVRIVRDLQRLDQLVVAEIGAEPRSRIVGLRGLSHRVDAEADVSGSAGGAGRARDRRRGRSK